MADKVAVVALVDPLTAVAQRLSQFGAAIVASRKALIDSRLTDDAITAGRFTLATTGSGSGAILDRTLILATGATAGSTAVFQSARSIHSVVNFENEIAALLMLTNQLQADNTIRWGAFTLTDGIFYQIRNGIFSVVRRKASVDDVVTTLNGTSPFTLDANRHAYQLRYTTAGARFQQDASLVHSMAAVTQGPLFTLEDVPFRIEVANGVTAGNTGMVFDGFIAQRWSGDGGTEPGPIGAAEARIPTSTTSVKLADENLLRKRLIIHNDSNHELKVKFGAGPASPTSYTRTVPARGDFLLDGSWWAGQVHGILDAGTGAAQVTIITEA